MSAENMENNGYKPADINLSEMQNDNSNNSFIRSQSLPQNSTKQQDGVTALTNGHQVTNRFHRLKYQFHKPEDLDDSALTTKVISKDFCSRTSSQGINHIYYAPSGIKKIIWLVLTIAAFTLLIAHVAFLVMRYVDFETTTEVSVVPYKTMEFPAVTICNINGEKAEAPPPFSFAPVTTDIPRKDIKLDSRPVYEELSHDQLHVKENSIVKAKFDDKILNLNEFDGFMNPEYGYCVTFNKYDQLRQLRSSRRSLPGYGLDLLLNIETYGYQEPLDRAPVHAAVIKLHHPDVDPVPDEGNILVSPGTLNRISVTKTNLTRLGSKYGDCLARNETNRSYTKQSCENKCLQTAVMSECCCYIHIFGHHPPKNKVWDDCDPKSSCCGREISACNDTITDCWNDVWNRYDKGNITCNHCLDPCKEIRYSQSIQAVPWPRDDYEYKVEADMADLLKEVDYFNRSDIKSYLFPDEGYDNETTLTFSQIKANFVKVQIYFESMTTLTIKEVADYGDFEFVSELGGTFGLWAGWTVMTMMEFFEFLVDLIVLYNLKRKLKSTQRKN